MAIHHQQALSAVVLAVTEHKQRTEHQRM